MIGGFYEEIIFRGFIQKTFQQGFQKQKHAFWIAGIITSIYLAYTLGSKGSLEWWPPSWEDYSEFLLSGYKGNLWFPIASHAIFDSIPLSFPGK